MTDQVRLALKNIILTAGQLQAGERFLVVSDDNTKSIGDLFHSFCTNNKLQCRHVTIPPLVVHGSEPPEKLGKLFGEFNLIAGLTSFSMAHSQARKDFTNAGGRYLSLPDFDMDVLRSKALEVDFFQQRKLAARIAALLSQTNKVRVTSALGMDLELTIKGRVPNNCDCILDYPGSMASPPDIEVNVAPLETETKGVIVVDSSIPHPVFGLLKTPMKLTFENSKVSKIESDDAEYIKKLEGLFTKFGDNARIVGELGFGLNPLAKPTGKMLEDEGAMGYVHFGLGSNITIGGQNRVSFHLDCVCSAPDIWFDDVLIMQKGDYL
ncbi:aminopeptidase [soil metagenome]